MGSTQWQPWLRMGRVRLGYSAVVLIVLLSLSFVAPLRAHAVAAFVQASTPVVNNKNGNTVTGSFATVPVSGDLLVIVCTATANVSFSAPTGFSTAAPSVSGNVSQAIYYKISNGTETTTTCTASAKIRNPISIQMYEYNGVVATGTLEGSSSASGTTALVSSGTYTPTLSPSLMFAAVASTSATGAYTGTTAGYTVRSDNFSSIHIAAADMVTNATTAQSFSATNSSATSWVGQIVAFQSQSGNLTADIVDGSGVSVASPSAVFGAVIYSFNCQTTTAVLGTNTQKIRVSNTTANTTWTLSIAPTAGPTATWSDGSHTYDVNDPTSGGCADGPDADMVAGQMTVKPSTGTITPVNCTATGVSLGADTAFSQGVTDSITLAHAVSSSDMNCTWDITGITLSQTIPGEQAISSGYTLSMTVTILAQ